MNYSVLLNFIGEILFNVEIDIKLKTYNVGILGDHFVGKTGLKNRLAYGNYSKLQKKPSNTAKNNAKDNLSIKTFRYKNIEHRVKIYCLDGRTARLRKTTVLFEI